MIVARTGTVVRIREIQTHGSVVAVAQSGSRCAINLSGIDADELQRGDALVRENDWYMSNAFDARINVLPALQHALTHREFCKPTLLTLANPVLCEFDSSIPCH